MTHFHQVCEASQHCIRVLLSPASQTGSAPAWQWIPYFLHLASRHCGWDWLSSLKHSHANFHCGLLFISSAAPAIKPGNMLGPECAHLGHCPLFCSPKSLHPLLPFLLVLSYVVSTSWVKEIGKCRKLQAKDRELKGLHVLEKAAQHQREPEPLLKGCRNFSIKPFKAIHTIPAWKAQKDTDISYGLTKSKSVVNR